jgi:hypothetical protein
VLASGESGAVWDWPAQNCCILLQVPTSSRDSGPPLRARRGFLGGLGFGSLFSRAKAPESPPKPPVIQQVGSVSASSTVVRAGVRMRMLPCYTSFVPR